MRSAFWKRDIHLRILALILVTGALAFASAASAAPAVLISIAATESELLVTIKGPPLPSVQLFELPAHTHTEATDVPVVAWEGAGREQITIPRFEGQRDRLYAPFALRVPGEDQPLTPPQWVTDFSSLPVRARNFLQPTTKKGFNSVVDVKDIVEIGAGHASLNIDLRPLVAPRAADPEFYTIVDGQKVGMRADRVKAIDREVSDLTAAGINVTAILLSYARAGQKGDPFVHPDTDLAQTPTGVVAFNTATAEGLLLYRAAIQFIIERYTRPDAPHGLISGAIVGNEVQSHWMWYNLGEANAEAVIREYHVALRITDLVARSTCAGFKVFVSMDHHWAATAAPGRPMRGLRGDLLLEGLNTLAISQGNFPWALAHHPYPSNLFDARFWNDRDALFRIDTPKITFKNLEVLPSFLRQERFLYEGKPRSLALTEQGFHRPDGAEGEELQAAALALGYRKLDLIPEIEFFLLHRHQDHPHEGGLNLGVLDQDKRRTKSWVYYQGIDTPRAQQLVEDARVTAGLADLALLNSRHVEMVPRKTPESNAIYNFVTRSTDATISDAADYRVGYVVKAAGWLAPAILMHPTGNSKNARARFQVLLPAAKVGGKLMLEFGTALEAPSRDGVGFRISIEEEQIFSHNQTTQAYQPHVLDITARAGKQVTIDLVIDPLGDTIHDLAAWVEPAIHAR